MKYTIVSNIFVKELVASVALKIKDGWEPIGGVTFVQEDSSEYLQAMIKRDQPGYYDTRL